MNRSRKKGPKPPESFSLAIFSSHPISFSHLHLTQMSKASLLGRRQIHNGAKTLIATGWKFSHEMLLKGPGARRDEPYGHGWRWIVTEVDGVPAPEGNGEAVD